MQGVIYIDQFGPPDPSGTQETQVIFERTGYGVDTQKEYSKSGLSAVAGIYPAQAPQPRSKGFLTTDPEDFSDSPTSAPDMLDRLRYAYGRPSSGVDTYGTLIGDNALVVRQLEFEYSGCGVSAQTKTYDSGHLSTNTFQRTSHIAVTENNVRVGDNSVEQFAFLLTATPVPFSIKNPVDSDVYIRLGNHSIYPLASGTVSLRLADKVVTGLEVVPFYGGNGGIDVYWSNTEEFPYGTRIDVEWEVFDTAVPANKVTIPYWFVTVDDTVGPRLISRSPVDDALDVPITASIIFDVVDYETGVNITTLQLFVNNILVDPGLFYTAVIMGGYRVFYTPVNPFLYGDTVPVVVKIRDMSRDQNLGFFVWSFTTSGSVPPTLLNMSPYPCETNVARIRNISFEVIDGGHGLDKNTVSFGIEDSQRDGVFIVPIIHRP